MTKEKKEIRIPLEEEIWGFRLYDQNSIPGVSFCNIQRTG